MTFGRFKGVEIADLPDAYVGWLDGLDDLREPLLSGVDREWRARFEPEAPPANAEPLSADVRGMIAEIITAGYRVIARRAHPDHGGETRTMQLVAEAAAWLRHAVRGAPPA